MLRHLLHKEILEHLLSLRFIILSALGGMVIWLSLFSGYEYYRECLRDYNLAQAVSEERLREIVVRKDLKEAALKGYPVFKPPTPMSIFVRGLDPTLGRMGALAFRDMRRLSYSPVAEEPILGVFPPLDLGLAVQVALSLFVLLLTYDAVCGEKTAGTLCLIASSPVSKDQLLLSKLIGALLPTLAAFGLPMLLGIGVVLAMPNVTLGNAELVRLGGILAVFAAYLIAFTCAGLCASCLTHRAATSFVLLLTFWVGTVTILPRLSLIAADGIRPAPSVQQYQAELRAVGVTRNRERFEDHTRWSREYRERTGKSWWATTEGREARTLYRKEAQEKFSAKYRPIMDQLERQFDNRYNARLSLAVMLARLSPAFALNNATVELAGTGRQRHQRFWEHFSRTRQAHTDWYWEEVTLHGLLQARPPAPGTRTSDAQDFSDIPRLIFQEAPPDAELATALVDIGTLALWALVLFLVSYVALLRYDFR